MKSLHVLCITFVLACSPKAPSQDAEKMEFKNAEAKQTTETFAKTIETAKNRFAEAVGVATERYNTEVESLKNQHIEKMESIQKATTQSNDLDEAIKIRDAIKSLRELKIELPELQKQAALAEEKIRDLQKQVDELTVTKIEKQSPTLSGTWRWFDGRDTVFGMTGQATHAQQLHGKWRLNDGSKDSYSVTWQNGSTDTLKILEKGKLLEGTSTDKIRVWAVRLK